jgi:VWFA-related protein
MSSRNGFARIGCFICCAVILFAVRGLSEENPSASPLKQSNTEPGRFVLHKNVRQVIVDVTVRDPNNNPVHGLTAKDFTIFEDSHPQRILSFESHQVDTPSLSLPPNTILPANVFINVPKRPERGPLYVILYDMVNMETDDQIYARQQALDFIRSKPEGTRFAIYVHSDGLHLIQGFTEDKDLIYAALDTQSPKPHVPKSFLMSQNYGMNDPIAMMSVMTHIAESLDGISGRKNLIWLAGRFPLALYPREGDPQDLRDEEKHAIDELARAQIAVYPVSIRGVIVNPEGALTGSRPNGGSTALAQVMGDPRGGSSSTSSLSNPLAGGVAQAGQTAGHGASLNRDYAGMNDVAVATGGHAFYSNNGIKDLLAEAVEDGGDYYTISYSPSNPNYDGNLRQIAVKLNSGGYTLSYRRSYYADDPEAAPSKTKHAKSEDQEQAEVKQEERPIYAGLQLGAPLLHQLIFKVHIHPAGSPTLATPEQMTQLAGQPAFASRNNGTKSIDPIQVQTYSIYYVITADQIKTAKGQELPLEFAAVAFNSDGRVVNGVFENAGDQNSSQLLQTAASEAAGKNIYRAMQEIVVPMTASSMRIAVRDISTDRVGSLEVPLPINPEPTPATARPVGSSSADGSVHPN